MRPAGLRRLVALVLLASVGLTAATNVSCTMTVPQAQRSAAAHPREASPSPAPSSHAHHAPAPERASASHEPAAAHTDGDAPSHERSHDGDNCGLLMACGLAAPAARVADVAFQHEPFEAVTAAVRDVHESANLSFDPPPPRVLLA
jgi:hypothetical protein